jgi:hypothetical protein
MTARDGHPHGLRVWDAWQWLTMGLNRVAAMQREQILSQMTSLCGRLGGLDAVRAFVDAVVARGAAGSAMAAKELE